MAELLAGALWVTALPLLAAAVYLFFLTLWSRATPCPPPADRRVAFDVVVPAHDEEQGIGRTVRSLLSLDHPRDAFRVLVVADNCSDRTADEARAAGAEVLVRTDPERRGKGYALAFAFERVLADGKADAAVVVDADTVVSPDLLSALAARVAAGERAIQADYAVLDAASAWRTRLMSIALGMFHRLRSAARERLGVSCGLRGNGMCFAAALLREVPHDAFSAVEDLEYGIRLGQAGQRVSYAAEAHVYGEMVAGERASRSQRQRWEGGRRELARRHGRALLLQGIARRDPLLLDLALDVLMPPLSTLAAGVALGLAASAALSVYLGRVASPLWAFAAAAAMLAAYALRGWQLSGTGARGLLDLLGAPWYVVWKLTLALRGSRPAAAEWVRTTREKRLP